MKKLTVVVFEPKWWNHLDEASNGSMIQYGEQVLYLGDISNVRDHCAVAKHNGDVLWLMHPEDFREVTEEEL